jgi:hypothetical protein
MSTSAKNKLLYTKRIPTNKREEIILKVVHYPTHYQFYFLYYIVGVFAFLPWFGAGYSGLILGFFGAGYVFYRYIRMNDSIVERMTYEREYPVKSIFEIHREHASDGLLLSGYSVAISVSVFIIQEVGGFSTAAL